MIDVTEASNKAKKYLASFFPDAEKVQLEEVELTDDKTHWLITLSYGEFPIQWRAPSWWVNP